MQPGFTLAPRDPFADAKETLSSWDKCMAKDYCKWPVIVAIIVGGIIAFSVVFCIARCICCGAECAICCCKCCTCCCGSSGSGHKRMQSENQGYAPPQPYPQQAYSQQPYSQQPYASPNPYAEARSFAPPPPPPQISTQYQSHPAPAVARQPSNPNFNPQVNPKFARAASPEQPQYATFDAHSKPVNEDALPQMPSWKDARSVQVEVDDEAVPEKRGDVEMDRLNHNGSVPNSTVAGVAVAGMRGSPGPGRSPVSPVQGTDAYGFPAGYQNGYDRRGSPAQNYMTPAQNYNAPPAQDYSATPAQNYTTPPAQNFPRGPSPAQSYSQYSQASDPYDRQSPVQRQPYTQPYAGLAQQNPYSPPAERYNSPAPPSYHTTANPYSYDPVPRSQTATPSAYPGQQTYQAFQPQGQSPPPQQQQAYAAVQRKPLEGSAREV